MIRINKNIEYALMALKHLEAKPKNELVQVKEICDLFKVSFDVMSRIMQRLAKAGVLKSVQGQRGGYFLIRDLKDTNLFEINECLQGKRPVAKCLEENFECDLQENCNIKASMSGLDNKISQFYKQLKVSDCIESEERI